MPRRLYRRKRGSTISGYTRKYALALVWLVIGVGLITASSLLVTFLPASNPSITLGNQEYEIPVITIGQIVIGFLGLFGLFKFIRMIGLRI